MHHIDDPALQALEARIAAITPTVSGSQRQELLYHCAFAAGHGAATKAVRRWQGATVALAILMVVMSAPWMRDMPAVAQRQPRQEQPNPTPAPSADAQSPVAEMPGGRARPPVKIETDAWQVTPGSGDTLSNTLAQLQQSDPTLQPFDVVSLTRSALHQ